MSETGIESPQPPATGHGDSFLAPLRFQPFLILWTATVVSNIGSWMQSAAAGWFMTTLNPRPFTVALVQVVSSLPMFIFAIPAGALGDIVDRRKLIIATQVALTAFILCFTLLIRFDLVTSNILLVFIFLAAACSAVIMPVWQSIVPLLVPRAFLQPAVALNSVGVNVSRASGGQFLDEVRRGAPDTGEHLFRAFGSDRRFRADRLHLCALRREPSNVPASVE